MSAVAPLCVFALITLAGSCGGADNFNSTVSHGKVELPAGCLYEGRWYRVGAAVRTRAACLTCACVGGALSCRRRICPPLPALPPRCHTLHRRDDCCPHIHCPDGVKLGAMPESPEESTDQHVSFALPACVEGGTVYAAGSAMSSNVACEQCFCLGGARRCVRPQCLPLQPGCQPRPTPGACCPDRYYCEHPTTLPPHDRNPNDCLTGTGQWVEEGQPVASAAGPCTQCFCLRGRIQCQHLSCAPHLQGCTPLVQPGQCCPHQYNCKHRLELQPPSANSKNFFESYKNEDRAFHSSKTTKRETTVQTLSTALGNNISTVAIDNLLTTKSNEKESFEATLSTIVMPESTETEKATANDVTTMNEISTAEMTTDSSTTEQPEGSVKIMINGTINCTSELSSTAFYNITSFNDTQPRIPLADETDIEAQTFPASEIITERPHNQELDSSGSFVVNVSSSLRTNATLPSSAVVSISSTPVLPNTDLPIASGTHNISKKTKEDPDYDYSEPTLPPSLPNLKIIPFVAADAVVDEHVASKESPYPVIDSQENFPIYHPNPDRNIFSERREDIYSPVFTNQDETNYALGQKTQEMYANKIKEIEEPMEFTIGASFNNAKETKAVHNIPLEDNMDSDKPAKNLFSPPVQTEGGFIPKGPGLVEGYYALYPSTPSGPVIPHLTTSAELDYKGKCIANDGTQVEEGETVKQACSSCTCAWGELHCSPLPCPVPAGCFRQPSLLDLCCGELTCLNGVYTTSTEKSSLFNTTETNSQDLNVNKSLVNAIDISITTSNSAEIDVVEDSGSVIKNQMVIQHTSPSTIIRPSLITTQLVSTEIAPIETNDTAAQLDQYEDDDTDDGFSLGSVLQLLLSESYEATTTVPFKQLPPNVMPHPPKRSHSPTSSMSTTTTKKPSQPSIQSNQHSFIPSNKMNSVNRIDHLVLGEATAIRRSTPPPLTTKRAMTTRKVFTRSTQRPSTSTTVEVMSKGHAGQTTEAKPPIFGSIAGLPKVAGCNIYGRMYGVGRIIAELATSCQECKCTEVGVQCRQLTC